MIERPPSRARAAGFTLPAVLVVAAAMLILAVGLLALVNIENKTARSFADSKRAELAARAGLEDFRALLRAETANDDFLVLAAPSPNTPPPGLEAPDHLFIARGEGGGDRLKYRYLPLFSSRTLPADGSTLKAPPVEPFENTGHAAIPGPPWLDKPRVEWIEVTDAKGAVVARYAYWVEDLQAKIDATTAGNTDGEGGTHSRNEWPFPAPGINPEPPSPEEHRLDRVALHALDPAATENGDGKLVARVAEGRPLMVSPESIVAATGFAPPLRRAATGLLEDPLAAALEKNASPVTMPYYEFPRVPFAAGISAEAAGKLKLNLNALLGKSRETAIDEFAGWIDEALPLFTQRKGGFPDDYLKTLAANAFDYADADNDPTVVENSHRGLDGYPLVSEHLLALKAENIVREDGRTFVILSATMFVELWNMSDQPAEGSAQVSFETLYSPALGVVPAGAYVLGDPALLGDPTVTTTDFVPDGGLYWSPPLAVSLRPNEHRVYRAGEARFKLDAGPASAFVPSPIELGNDDNQSSGYRLKWNGNVVDSARGKQRRYDQQLHYPGNNATNSNQKVAATLPGHSYKLKTEAFVNNLGDPRMSMYLSAPQDANSWPQNYSPNRRTIRWGSIYSSDSAAKRRHYGRVLPSEWPDGGHNSAYGSNSFFTEDRRVVPDDPRFFSNLPTPVREQAPMRLSNLGRFYSATELGRTYDPVMWVPTYGNLPDSPGSGARDTATLNAPSTPSLPTARSSWPDVEPNSPPSSSAGGGNTLRIGRAEHPRFEEPGLHAAHLLDLFHAGESTSDSAEAREGNLVLRQGHVNLNTATPDALRALAAGFLKQDPLLSQTTSSNHQTSTLMALPVAPLRLGTPTRALIADRVAEAILRSRPFASAAELASARDRDDKPVFGNREMYAQNARIQWTDSAAEEVFARIHDASTFRSRNFRIWVIGQALAPPLAGATEPRVLAESKKVFTVFAGPEEYSADGTIDPATYRPRVIHENDF
jgi:type II secretory pathway pseudopilin PulG